MDVVIIQHVPRMTIDECGRESIRAQIMADNASRAVCA